MTAMKYAGKMVSGARARFPRHGLRAMTRAAALSALMALSGCGDGSQGQEAAGRKDFDMLSRADATVVVAANLDKEQAFKVADYYIERIAAFIPEEDYVRKMKDEFAAFKQDPLRDAGPEERKFLEESGLSAATFRWAVLSVDGPLDLKAKDPDLSVVSLAVATDADLGKVIAAAQKRIEESGKKEASFEELEVEGEKAWHVVPNDGDFDKTCKKTGADLHVAALDGKLVIAAFSRDALEKQIRLYRKGEGKGDALGGFSAKDGELFHLRISGIGEIVRANASDIELEALSKTIPNGAEIAKGLKFFEADGNISTNGVLVQTLALATASPEDAEAVRSFVKGGISTLKMMLPRNDSVPKEVAGFLTQIKIAGEGNMVEVRNADVVAFAAGALFPAISSAMTAANGSAMAMKGRNIFVGLIKANVDRESLGFPSVWPRTAVEADARQNDISGKAFATSKDYFGDLLDAGNYAKEDWAPYVDFDASALGKDVVKGGALDLGGLEWCVAANVTDAMPDCVPVLVSANFNPEYLLDKWDGRTDAARHLPIGPASGAAKSLFGDKFVVIVSKGGAARVIKKAQLTYNAIYDGQAFSLNAEMPPLAYLTPNGVAKPTGRK